MDSEQIFKVMIPYEMSISKHFEVRLNKEKYNSSVAYEFIDGDAVDDVYKGGIIFEIIIAPINLSDISGEVIETEVDNAYYYNPTTGPIEDSGFLKMIEYYSEYYDEIGQSIEILKQ